MKRDPFKERQTLAILDNSSINNIADGLSVQGVRAFRQHLRRSRVVVAATSINLIEISRTPDEHRSQRLLATLIEIAAGRPLADPETLIVESIEQIVARERRDGFSEHRVWATGSLRRLWNNLRTGKHNLLYPTLGLDKCIALYRLFFSICLSGLPNEAALASIETGDLASTLQATARELARKAKPNRPFHLARLAAAVWFSSGLFPRSDIVEKFWLSRKLRTTRERFEWLLAGRGRRAFEIGPLVGLGATLWSQTNSGWDEGHLMDSMQLVLLPHVDVFVTDDHRLRGMLDGWPAKRRKQICSTAEWFARVSRSG